MANKVEVICTKATGSLITLSLLVLVGWTYYVAMIVIITRTFQQTASQILVGIIYHVIFLLMEISHFRAVLCSSNKPPTSVFSINPNHNTAPADQQSPQIDNLSLDTESLKKIEERIVQTYNIRQRMSDGNIRICRICQIVKPDRCHHCSYCEHCILKMDHHCPWVNNCLGFYNYKFFVLYLGYTIVYCLFLSILSLVVLLNRPIYNIFEKSTPQPFQIYLLLILSMAFLFGVLFLKFFHFSLIAKNRTTLEESRASNFVDGIKISPYNYGMRKNWIEVFGTNPLLWFLPIFSSVGNGLEFPVSNHINDVSP